MGIGSVRRKGRYWGFTVRFGKRDGYDPPIEKNYFRWSTPEEAERVRNIVKARLELNLLTPTDDPLGEPSPKRTMGAVPFDAYALEWLTTYAEPNLKTTTVRTYRSCIVNHLVPYFGGRHLSRIDRRKVMAFIGHLRDEEIHDKTIYNILIPLRRMLNHAVDAEMIPTNPAARTGEWVSLKRWQAERREAMTPLNSEELTRLLALSARDDPQQHLAYVLAGKCGLRMGEALGLKWGDIALGDDVGQGRYIHVVRAWVERAYVPTKTYEQRYVDMSRGVCDELRAWDRRCVERILREGRELSEVVLEGRRPDRPMDQTYLNRVLKRACRRAGVPQVTYQNLRHSYATIMLYEKDAPLQYVSEQLGHKSVDVTTRIYGHPRPGSRP
ncbi:site-specific integrase, partial [Nitrospinae bacterium AH-259-F20]|nr:site-specific integrase [Nitrospinae bacterium AH-259-F20]